MLSAPDALSFCAMLLMSLALPVWAALLRDRRQAGAVRGGRWGQGGRMRYRAVWACQVGLAGAGLVVVCVPAAAPVALAVAGAICAGCGLRFRGDNRGSEEAPAAR